MAAPQDPFDFAPHTAPDARSMNERFGILYDALDNGAVGLDAGSFQNGAFTAAKFAAHQGWQTIAWSYSIIPIAFYKDQLGWVHFRPSLMPTSVEIPSGAQLNTTPLPVGYRPGFLAAVVFWKAGGSGGAQTPLMASVDTSGIIRHAYGGGNGTSGAQPAGDIVLYGRFKAEN